LYARADLSAFGDPAFNSFNVNAQTLFLAASDRVKEAESINKASVTRLATVGYRHVIKGPLLGAASRQSNDHHSVLSSILAESPVFAGPRIKRARRIQ
jgi:hypothetical protein